MEFRKAKCLGDNFQATECFKIAMICDFFYPNMGGVENHIYHLSQQLVSRGHKVIVITHKYAERVGVRYLRNTIKVYYLPFGIFHNQCILPTIYSTFPFVRDILIREAIEIVHGHSAFSTLCHDVLLHARTMGLNTIFTDHSLFGFADPSSVITNKFLEFSLADVNHVICVSNTSKENTVLRASLDPHVVSVIPNAVDAKHFQPDPQKRKPGRVTIVVTSRLVYRKGMDLLAGIIPVVCQKHNNVYFLIGGDGPKRVILEEVREKYRLHDRIKMLGSLKHSEVKEVLIQGDIFLNTSLTEAFCMSILEAAFCGLQVVSTCVGGIPEVLPPHMITLAEPKVESLIAALENAIQFTKKCEVMDPWKGRNSCQNIYCWSDIARRTEKVYCKVLNAERPSMKSRLQKFYACAPVAGKIYSFLVLLDILMFLLLEIIFPRQNIDICPSAVQRPCRTIQSARGGRGLETGEDSEKSSCYAKVDA